MSYKFRILQNTEFMEDFKALEGIAVRNNISQTAHFVIGVSPDEVELTVEPDKEGFRLIDYFIKMLGSPAEHFHEKTDNVYIAKWDTRKEDAQKMFEHIMQHRQLERV
jgi:hypothetical protein